MEKIFIKDKNEYEKEGCFWLSKIILCFNLKDVFSEYLVIQKELSKHEQEQNHD